MIPGTGDAYLDRATTYLLIRAKVVRAVGPDLAADRPVATLNNWLHSLFSQVDVYINATRLRGKSELDLFAVPPTQTSIEDGRWVEHQPLRSLDLGVH